MFNIFKSFPVCDSIFPICNLPNEPVEVAEPLTRVTLPSVKLVNRVYIEALGVVPSNTFDNPVPSPINLLALTLPVNCKLPV